MLYQASSGISLSTNSFPKNKFGTGLKNSTIIPLLYIAVVVFISDMA
jgi:hypothetical protein